MPDTGEHPAKDIAGRTDEKDISVRADGHEGASPLIEAQGLGFHHPGGRWLFLGLDLSLQAGEVLAILGPNGCGKSTLLDVLLDIHRPQEGQVRKQATCSFVPQFFTPPFAYSVLDIVLMGRSTHIQTFGTPSPQDVAIARQALADLGIDDLARRDFAQLSGGQRQLVLAARALATEAPIMLLDEPTSALDVHNQDRLLTLLHRLSHERGLTILFTTHQPNHALAVAHKTLLMTQPQARFGPTATVLTVDNLKQLFDIDMIRLPAELNGQRFENIVPVYATQLREPLHKSASALGPESAC